MSKKSNPGCLAAIMRLFGLQPKTSPVEATQPSANPELDPYPYRRRDDFLSPAEQSFYQVLKSMMGEYLTICPKVGLANIFFVSRPNENAGAYNRIDRKHVDFLMCDPKTMQPQFAIELDDRSHQRPDREERDDFVNGVFEAADLPLIHVPARNAYNTAELGVLFRQTLQKGTSITETHNSSPVVEEITPAPPGKTPDTIPVCPKCGVRMVLRTARQGTQAGKQFYGCPNYPKCREVIPYGNQLQKA